MKFASRRSGGRIATDHRMNRILVFGLMDYFVHFKVTSLSIVTIFVLAGGGAPGSPELGSAGR